MITTSKDEIKAEFEKHGITVLRVTRDGNGYRVSIHWRDYLKYRDSKLVNLARVAIIKAK